MPFLNEYLAYWDKILSNFFNTSFDEIFLSFLGQKLKLVEYQFIGQ